VLLIDRDRNDHDDKRHQQKSSAGRSHPRPLGASSAASRSVTRWARRLVSRRAASCAVSPATGTSSPVRATRDLFCRPAAIAFVNAGRPSGCCRYAFRHRRPDADGLSAMCSVAAQRRGLRTHMACRGRRRVRPIKNPD
jgi:hypothetical protein